MIRTQIQLDDSLYERLRRVAMEQRRSMADCVREAVADFLRSAQPAPTGFADIAGVFRPLPASDVKAHDRYWSEAVIGGAERT